MNMSIERWIQRRRMMKVKDLIKELQEMPQNKNVSVFIPKVFGEDNKQDIYDEDLSHIIEQDDNNVELYFRGGEE